jgi:hypothetical protein
MTKVARKRRSYTEDFKRDAVALVTEQGYKVSEAARSLDSGENLVRRWRREFGEEAWGAGGLNADERYLLVRFALMFNPSSNMPPIWVKVCPMNNTTFIVPLILSKKFYGIPWTQTVDSGCQIDVVTD